VRIVANAISYVDLLFARGNYQVKPPLPLVPGTEFSGVITALGVGVADVAVGQRVTGMTVGGAWAQFTCVPATAVEALPEQVDMHAASALPVTYATALYALKRRGALRAGETVLVLGAAGGVGLACVQVAKALGVDPSTLSRWRSQGVGPRVCWLAKSCPRYREDDVREWLERNSS